MAYVTTGQLESRLGAPLYARLTDRASGTTADETVAAQIVAEAQAEADSFLARRYATPVDLAAHPELAAILEARVLDLAEWLAWKSSPFVSDCPQRVYRLHEAARRWFEDVARGRTTLPASSPAAGPTACENGPRYRGGRRVFAADELDGL